MKEDHIDIVSLQDYWNQPPINPSLGSQQGPQTTSLLAFLNKRRRDVEEWE